MKSLISKRYFLATAVSSLLSIFMVAVVAYGATMTISSTGLGSGTSTPGAAVGAAGAGIFEGFVSANYFTSTSSNTSWLLGGNFGLGTTTPGAKVGVRGGLIVDDFVNASFFNATSTTATSTTRYGMTIASTTIVDGQSGRWAIGTSTFPDGDTMGLTGGNPDPGLTITGVGNSASATGTLYVAGGGATGGQIIIKSSDGTRCITVMAQGTGVAIDASANSIATLLTAKVTACPR